MEKARDTGRNSFLTSPATVNCLLMLIIFSTIAIPLIFINLNKMHKEKPMRERNSSCFSYPSEVSDGFFSSAPGG